MKSPMDRYDAALKDLQANSRAYQSWQEAIAVRDNIMRDDGLGTIEFDRIKEVIKYWCTIYEEEVKGMKVSMGNELTKQVNALYDAMVVHQSAHSSK